MSKSKPVEVAEEEKVDNLKKYPNFDEPQEYQELLNVAKKRFLNRKSIINGGEEIYKITEDENKLTSKIKTTTKKEILIKETEIFNIKNDIIVGTVSKLMQFRDATNDGYNEKRIKTLLHFSENILPLQNINFNDKTEEEQILYVDNLFKVIVFRFYCLCREDLIIKIKRKFYEQNIMNTGNHEQLINHYGTDNYEKALDAFITKTSAKQKGFELLSKYIEDTLNAMLRIVNENKPMDDKNYMLNLYTTIDCSNKKSRIQNIAISMFKDIPETLKFVKEEREEKEANQAKK